MIKFVLKISLISLFALGVLLGLYATCIEPFRLNVTEWTVETPQWTNPKPLKIALISDTHIIWPSMTPAHLEDIVARTNALKPDVILLLGDYVGTHHFGLQIDPKDGIAPLQKLAAPCGVFAVLGNHDFHEGMKGWPEALQRTKKIRVLQNQAVPVTCNNQAFWVAGLGEYRMSEADIPKTLKQIKSKSPVILMMHEPDSFPETPDSIALNVAGHTHGGQIVLPLIGMVPAVIPSKYGTRYAYGHITENGKNLVVSSGLGMTGLPMRFMRPPEITLVTLSGQKFKK